MIPPYVCVKLKRIAFGNVIILLNAYIVKKKLANKKQKMHTAFHIEPCA